MGLFGCIIKNAFTAPNADCPLYVPNGSNCLSMWSDFFFFFFLGGGGGVDLFSLFVGMTLRGKDS